MEKLNTSHALESSLTVPQEKIEPYICQTKIETKKHSISCSRAKSLPLEATRQTQKGSSFYNEPTPIIRSYNHPSEAREPSQTEKEFGLPSNTTLKNLKPTVSLVEKKGKEQESNYCANQLSFFQKQAPNNLQHLYQPIEHLSFSSPDEGLRIDLHGKSVEQAEKIVINIIKQAKNLNIKRIHFICGRGKHKSAKGQRGTIFRVFPQWIMKENVSSLIKSFEKGLGTYEIFLHSAPSNGSTSGYVLNADIIQQLAELNNPDAQFSLGELYFKGFQLKKDFKSAVNCYRQAANQGHAEAQLKLGYMYAMGQGTCYNPKEALFWYNKAAELGSAFAYFNLGTMHYVGEGVNQDLQKAAKYYRQGARLNNPLCQRMLGILYGEGLGVNQNDGKAIYWNRLAVENGDGHAKVNLGDMLLSGKGSPPDALGAFKLFKEATQEEITQAYFRLGEMYAYGQGIEKDLHQAIGWFTKAALKDDDWSSYEAQFIIGSFYYKGIILKQEDTKAAYWYLKAAENGHSEAQWWIGLLYRLGAGVTRDLIKSYEWLKVSAKKGNHWGQYHLGEVYGGGFGIKENKKLSLMWMHKAAKQGNAMACIMINRIPKDLQKEIDQNDIRKLDAYGLAVWDLPQEVKARLDKEECSKASISKEEEIILDKKLRKEEEGNKKIKTQEEIYLSKKQPKLSINPKENSKESPTFPGEEIPEENSVPQVAIFNSPKNVVDPSTSILVLAPIIPEQGWFHKLFGFPFPRLRDPSKPFIGLI
ncbi:MAG: SEL1-like repeat protein [Candidatus Paracaedibacteraceae bacterium]|nr:SEL1-like repeat protein [Candidatus Paracaedibacteraceae bacterium]